ncbi:MAG: hypothetical protein KY454_04605 [Actinobacteria bacterium]|nr:hypothetical protein [Actinomycetota bacterium]MBW3650618.1 hypothetical protein [Actinomycetota bacterium]
MPVDPSAPIPDANDADAAEQAVPVDPASSGVEHRISADPEAPEADGLEQAQEVPLPDDER